ncbi:unnamed protein product [Oikopleura dioica]|uniref:Uncharacterized protein n=1 Tax=Oikopleura dioica TaxID=34765 RepID=E4XRU4_OIKDI|nr:unnamed protein product [Oikopleura dioica]
MIFWSAVALFLASCRLAAAEKIWGGDYFRCSSYFRTIKASTGTRFMYVFVLFIFTSFSVFLLSDTVKQRFFDASFVCNTLKSGYKKLFISLRRPDASTRHLPHFFKSFFLPRDPAFRDSWHENEPDCVCRPVNRLHNGFWFWKSALLLVNLYATFKVNISPAMNLLMIVGVFGGCMFLIIQLFCLYDLATNVALSWELAAIERGYHWNILIWTLSLLFSVCVNLFVSDDALHFQFFKQRRKRARNNPAIETCSKRTHRFQILPVHSQPHRQRRRLSSRHATCSFEDPF